jgi:tRNA modification GTPase
MVSSKKFEILESELSGIINSHLISATSGSGIDKLLAAVTRHAEQFLASTESALVTRDRHRALLGEAADALKRAESVAAGDEALIAEEIRLAARALGRLLGRVDVEDVLDVIFRDFCIGK